MTTIDRSKGFERQWGTFITKAPLVQTYPTGQYKQNGTIINPTRTWLVNDQHIPVISGDSMRGILRRTLAYDLLERLGIEQGKVPLSVAHLLLAGGALGNLQNTLTTQTILNVRHLFPPIALLGGTVHGGFVAGRLMAGAWVAQTAQTPATAVHVDDDVLPPASSVMSYEHFAKRGTEDQDAWLQDEAGLVEVSTAEGKEESGRTAGSPMPFTYRVVNPDVVFAGWVALGSYRGLTPEDDEVQRACLRFGLETAFHPGQETTLGLRASQGYGVVTFDWDLSGIGGDRDVYFEFLQQNKEEITQWLLQDLVPVVDAGKLEKRQKKAEANKSRAKRTSPSRQAGEAQEGATASSPVPGPGSGDEDGAARTSAPLSMPVVQLEFADDEAS